MEQFLINGSKNLSGNIDVTGSKNAATPIIAATLLTKKDCVISNIPRILDVLTMLEILKKMGASVDFLDERTVKINTSYADPSKIDKNLFSKLRSSLLFIGPLLARFGEASVPHPGGCKIGARPLDAHLSALEDMGAKIDMAGDDYIFRSGNLSGGEVTLKEFSVTATENVLMAASFLSENTILRVSAVEPHVLDLVKFLVAMGSDIKLVDSHTFSIKGKKNLSGAEHFLIYDQTEAGTFLIISALCNGNVIIKNVNPDHLALVFRKLKEFGVEYSFTSQKNRLKNIFSVSIKSKKPLMAAKVQTMPYPGIPTDLQTSFGVLATQAEGTSLIHDILFESRLKYIGELKKMGANVTICDPHRVLISGPTPLFGTHISSFDLRSGAALIIAALIAHGNTTIDGIEQVDRGYENLDERLRNIGADITRLTLT